MPIVNMNDEDFEAYSLYLTLPASIRWSVRAVVSLCRSDQKLVQGFVQELAGRRPSCQSRSASTHVGTRRGRWRRRLMRLVEKAGPAA